MTKDVNYLDQLINKLKNRQILAYIIVIFIGIVGISNFTDALSNIITSIKSIFIFEEKLNDDGSFTHKGIKVRFEQLIGAFDIEYIKVLTSDHDAAIKAEHAYARTRYPDLTFSRQKLVAQLKNDEFRFVGSMNWPPGPSLPVLTEKEKEAVKYYYDILFLVSKNPSYNESKYICFDITPIIKNEVKVKSESDILEFIYKQNYLGQTPIKSLPK